MSSSERTQGMVFRTRPLTETSLIINWLTPECGRISTVAKGARKTNSPFRGKLDLFYLADLSFLRSRRSDLHTLREVVVHESFISLRENLTRLRQACYAAALIEQCTETETPLPQFYDLMCRFIKFVTAQEVHPLVIFAFELKILELLGQSPEGNPASLSPGSTKLLRVLRNSDFEMVPRLRASRRQETEIKNFLHGFLIYHLGKLPRNRAGALEKS